MKIVAPPPDASSGRLRLAGLFALSYVLRVSLALRGGQAYWPDEARFGVSRDAAFNLAGGHWRAALEELLRGSDHVLFRWVGLPVAALELWVGGYHPALAACCFGVFSAGVVWMVGSIALRSGASVSESTWAALFAAAANSLLYYSRHYFPYDISMFAMLVGLWLAVGPQSWRNSFLAGLAVGLGFLAYNGYWLLGACILVMHTLLGPGGLQRVGSRAGSAFLGLALPICLFLALGQAVCGDVLGSYRGFAASVTQGDFRMGYKVIPEYLWYAEGVLLPFLLAAFACALVFPSDGEGLRRLQLWLGSVAFLYLGLVLFSDVIPRFVVYGRLSRSLVPFICLGAGAGVARLLVACGKSRRAVSLALFAALACHTAAKFSVPFGQVFPNGFLRLFGQKVAKEEPGVYGFYTVLNTETFWGRPPVDERVEPGAREILRRPNPMQFRAYQYEGFSSAQRAELNSHDLSMRVLETPLALASPDHWDGYPGPVTLSLLFPRNRMSLAEPLLTSGVPGRGDIIYVRYLDSGHVALGYDHWGASGSETPPLPVDFGRSHEIMLSSGSLLPPPESILYRSRPELGIMRGQLLVTLDGQPVMLEPLDTHPSPRNSILFGANVIGGSSTEPYFTGTLTSIKQAPLERVAALIPVLASDVISGKRPPEWSNAVGPVRMDFTLPARTPSNEFGQPLASIMGARLRQVLFIVRVGDGARLCLDSVGIGAQWSGLVELSKSGTDEVDVSIGPMLPGESAGIYGGAPSYAKLRGLVCVRLDGRVALIGPTAVANPGPCRVVFGADLPGSSACTRYFQGRIDSIMPLGLRDVSLGAAAAPGLMRSLARPGWGGYTGPLHLDLEFSKGRAGDCQPLLTTGVAGRGDIVFVRYENEGVGRICVDHWGAALTVSEPFAMATGTRHLLTISLGSMCPAASADLRGRDLAEARRRSGERVELDGRPILDNENAAYPSPPEWLTIGANLLGSSGTGPIFLGTLYRVTPAPLEGDSQ